MNKDNVWLYHCVLADVRISHSVLFDWHKLIDVGMCIALLVYIFTSENLRCNYAKNFAVVVGLEIVIVLGQLAVSLTGLNCLNRPFLIRVLIESSFAIHAAVPCFILFLLLGMLYQIPEVIRKFVVIGAPFLLSIYPIYGQVMTSNHRHVIWSDRLIMAIVIANCAIGLFIIFQGQTSSYLPLLFTLWQAIPLFFTLFKMTFDLHHDSDLFLASETADDFAVMLITIGAAIILAIDNGSLPIRSKIEAQEGHELAETSADVFVL